jgi:hypothetical protein
MNLHYILITEVSASIMSPTAKKEARDLRLGLTAAAVQGVRSATF